MNIRDTNADFVRLMQAIDCKGFCVMFRTHADKCYKGFQKESCVEDRPSPLCRDLRGKGKVPNTHSLRIKEEPIENDEDDKQTERELSETLQTEMDLNAYQVVMLNRPVRPSYRPDSFTAERHWMRTISPLVVNLLSREALRRCQQDVRRLITDDPCPVPLKLHYSQIGDQLYVPPDWKQRAGSCDPYQQRTLPRPAKTIGYLLRLGMATLGEKVVYRGGREKVMAEGWIANNGILCARCGYVVGCTEFEKCAGMRMRKPGKHIHFSDGRSLLEYSHKLRSDFL